MKLQRRDQAPHHQRGEGQVSYLLLDRGQFGSRHLSTTWVECRPGSQQALHAHAGREQVYVIVRGRGEMLVAGEAEEVAEGDLVFVPPGAGHAIRNSSPDLLVYVSTTTPPLGAVVEGDRWRLEGVEF